jgi:hypothetical protein
LDAIMADAFGNDQPDDDAATKGKGGEQKNET